MLQQTVRDTINKIQKVINESQIAALGFLNLFVVEIDLPVSQPRVGKKSMLSIYMYPMHSKCRTAG